MKNGISEELLVFLTTLHELKHLGHAAQRLGMSAPKASRMLSEAREVFRDELFVRHGHGLAPTHRASVIAAKAAHVLDEMRMLAEEAVFSPGNLRRVFRGACLDNAIAMLIEPMLGAFQAAAPHAGMSLTTHNELTLSKLRAGELDFALFPAVNLPEDFLHVELIKTPYVHVVRPGHPLEALAGVTEEGEELWRKKAEGYRRIQIVVHPDTDSTQEGIPGPATIPTQADDTVFFTESWLGAVFLMRTTDALLTLPWRTALQAAKLQPLVVLGRAASVPWLVPSLITHRRSASDPAMVWLQSIFLTHVRGNFEALRPDDIRVGRIG